MSQRLPTHGSKWMKDSELTNDEVIKLWKSHNDYLLAPEKMKIDTTNNLLETFIQNITMFYITEILNNILNLEWYLKKVHRWMEPYIKKNTNLRKTASNSFEKDFFKTHEQLMKNNRKHQKETERNIDRWWKTSNQTVVKTKLWPCYNISWNFYCSTVWKRQKFFF